MDATDGGSPLLTALDESICHDAGIEFVVAFGSRATAGSGPSSDLDLAIKFDAGLSARDRFRKRCFLSGDLQRADGPFIDISDIETLPLDVPHDAVDGQFLCGDEAAFRAFRADVRAAFDTRRDEIRRHPRDTIERIAEEGLGG